VSRLVVALLLLSVASGARAERSAFVHVVRPGETLASIALRYYGDARRENVLVAANGLTTRGGSAIVVGLRLVVPWVSYHRVAPGETWQAIAAEHYGDPARWGELAEANPQNEGGPPDEGSEILVPYPLRHIAGVRDTPRSIAQLYYGDPGEAGRLIRFNEDLSRARARLPRGRIVLVPLSDLTLSDPGRQLVEAATGEALEGGTVRSEQARTQERLPRLREHVAEGRYTEAVALGNRLLGAGNLTGNQLVTIERELGVAYVALGRDDLARGAFLVALERQPDLELDSRRTSPLVLQAVAAAREALQERQRREAAEAARAAEADAGGADAGPVGAPATP
jgi:LysM repeat protein